MKTFKYQPSKTFVKELDKAATRGLIKLGGFVRVTARRSIRNRKGYSKPGEPPHSHKGTLKKGIRYEVEKGRFSVRILIGVNKDLQGQTPHILEYGGKARSFGSFYD